MPGLTHTYRLTRLDMTKDSSKRKELLALDPGSKALGWAIFDGGLLLELGVMKAENRAIEVRIAALLQGLNRLWLDKGPFHTVCMERATGFRGKIPPELMAIMARLRQWARQDVASQVYAEYHPSTIRATIAPKQLRESHPGAKPKELIRQGVYQVVPALADVGYSKQDAIDAAAVGLTHYAKAAAEAWSPEGVQRALLAERMG